MGYTTDFIGHIDVEPPLNQHEQAYLSAFAHSRRCQIRTGPYEVPGNPAADEMEWDSKTPWTAAETDRYNAVAPGQPGLWCGWAVGWSGRSFAHDGQEKFYRSIEWLVYLIEHFLRPGAHASASGLPYFQAFTFDHILDGVVAASRRDNRELYLIDVRENEVSKVLLRRGDPLEWEWETLPYEEQLDQRREEHRRRPRPALRLIDPVTHPSP